MSEERYSAFVFINTQPGRELDVLRDLRKCKGVTYAYEVGQLYHIVARVDANNARDFAEYMTAIRRTSDITAATPYITRG